MDTAEIAALLGLPSTDARVEEQLARFGIDDRPSVGIDANDADGPVVATQDWVINHAAGIEFGFQEEGAFMGLDASDQGAGPMILTEIYFYGDHATVRPYGGRMPFGIAATDSLDAVRAKLAPLEHTRRSYVRDTWEHPAFRMTVSYTDDRAHIAFVVCMLRYEASLPFEHCDAALPSIQTVVGLFGKRQDDPSLREIFVPLGLDRQRHDTDQVVDFRTTYGFELRFTKGSGRSQTLSQIVCYRDREMDARGWRSTLPRGIAFDDSPQVVEEKMGRPPDERADQEFTGFAVWHFDACSVCVYYSTMENVVLRVRVLAPGVWSQFKTE